MTLIGKPREVVEAQCRELGLTCEYIHDVLGGSLTITSDCMIVHYEMWTRNPARNYFFTRGRGMFAYPTFYAVCKPSRENHWLTVNNEFTHDPPEWLSTIVAFFFEGQP